LSKIIFLFSDRNCYELRCNIDLVSPFEVHDF
jgi:hypothetical protein